MSRWFRLDDDVVNDPKVQRLPGEKFKAWINLLCLASKNDGVLPKLSDIAFGLRMDDETVSSHLDEFCAMGLLDPVEVGDAPMSYEPHNWPARQYKSDVTDPTAPERMRRYRSNKRNERNGAVTVTPTRTDTEQKQNKPCRVSGETPTKQKYSDEFELNFWKPYPRTPIMSKKEAWREWMKLAPDQRLASCQALPAYLQHLKRTPTLQAVHACRFLSQNRAEGILEISAEKPKLDIRAHFV